MTRQSLFSVSGPLDERHCGSYGAALVREEGSGTDETRLVVYVNSDGGYNYNQRRESHRFVATDAEALEAFGGALVAMARALRGAR